MGITKCPDGYIQVGRKRHEKWKFSFALSDKSFWEMGRDLLSPSSVKGGCLLSNKSNGKFILGLPALSVV